MNNVIKDKNFEILVYDKEQKCCSIQAVGLL